MAGYSLAVVEQHRVRLLDAEMRTTATIGSWGEAHGRFKYPKAVAVNGHRMYVCDSGQDRIAVFEKAEAIQQRTVEGIRSNTAMRHVASIGGGERGAGTAFSRPRGLAYNKHDSRYALIVADTNNHRVLAFDEAGEFTLQICGEGHERGHVFGPCAVAVDRRGRIFVADSGNHRIMLFADLEQVKCSHYTSAPATHWCTETSEFLCEQAVQEYHLDKITRKFKCTRLEAPSFHCVAEIGVATTVKLKKPAAIALNARYGQLFVADAHTHSVEIFASDDFAKGHRHATTIEFDFNMPCGVAVLPDLDKAFVCDTGHQRLVEFAVAADHSVVHVATFPDTEGGPAGGVSAEEALSAASGELTAGNPGFDMPFGICALQDDEKSVKR